MDQRKITFLTPYYEQGRGNATTAKRIVYGLKKYGGVKAQVFAYDEEELTTEGKEAISKCSLLHILHFRRFAQWLEKEHLELSCPYVITSGGTDVNSDLYHPLYKKKMESVLEKAAAITVFSEDARQKLIDNFPSFQSKIEIVKQSIWFPDETEEYSFSSKGFPRILLPAGLRKVKDVLFVLPALIQLKKSYPQLHFTILGAIIEEEVYEEVYSLIQRYSWINFIQEIPLAKMKTVYKQFDFVINTSVSEGQSSSLLEAMSLGIPVVARENGGNGSIVSDGETGFLFGTSEEFLIKIEKLLKDDELKVKMLKNAKMYVHHYHSLQEEVASFLQIYEQIQKVVE